DRDRLLAGTTPRLFGHRPFTKRLSQYEIFKPRTNIDEDKRASPEVLSAMSGDSFELVVKVTVYSRIIPATDNLCADTGSLSRL
ncbi:MAG: hypothetical protein DRP09_16175, partial [Candidatus Thorarchaeota archaeon]